MAAHIGRIRHVVQTYQGLCRYWKSVLFYTMPRSLHCSCSLQSDQVSSSSAPKMNTKAEKISKAMKAYMERAKAHDTMISEEIADYEIGKRHLANMMGLDPDSISDEEIKHSIRYLLPSGLFDEKARPFMKHPYEVFPRRKAAQFGMDGRPFHSLFYTGKPNFYKLLYDVTWMLEDLKKEEDKLNKKGLMSLEADKKLSLFGSEWITNEELSTRMVETIGDKSHKQFVTVMTRLADHPLSYRQEEFIMKFRNKLETSSFGDDIKKPKMGSDGRECMTKKGFRKTARAVVTVRAGGSGKVTINGSDLEYFANMGEREQIMFPIQLTNKLGEIDVEAEVTKSGPMSQAGAVRHGLSRALCSFVDSSMVEKMRLAGLLTKDPRKRERKKPGQEKARKKFTWKKR